MQSLISLYCFTSISIGRRLGYHKEKKQKGLLMLITQYFNHSYIFLLIKVLELQKHSVSNGNTSIWIRGELHSGIPRMVTIGLYQFTKESMRLCVESTENGVALYSSLRVENPTAIPARRMAVLLRQLIKELSRGRTYNNLKFWRN